MSTTVGDLLRIKGAKVETITAAETVLDAIRRMSAKHIGCLAVVTKAGKLSGIVSERDCLWKVIAEGKSPKTNLVKDAMTPLKQMKTVAPGQTVEECMSLMTGRRHRHLPVLADGKLVGLISIGDVVAARLADLHMEKEALTGMIMGN